MSSNSALDNFGHYVDACTDVGVDSYEIAGIDPDYNHLVSGGYHVARNRLPRPDYSSGNPYVQNSSPRDRNGSGTESCAIDLGFAPDDMITVTNRLLDAVARNDPRMSVVREFNGTIDGVHTLNRDHELGWKQNYTPNSSHLHHEHVAFYRDVAGDWNAIKGVADIINGEDSEEDMNADQDHILRETHDRVMGRDVQRYVKLVNSRWVECAANDPDRTKQPARSADIGDIWTLIYLQQQTNAKLDALVTAINGLTAVQK